MKMIDCQLVDYPGNSSMNTLLILVGLILVSMNSVLKTLIVIESCMISVLYFLYAADFLLMNHVFIIVMAVAAIEAGIGFSLLVILLRSHSGTLNLMSQM